MAPVLSVVTATLNRRDYLPRCLESVTAQEYPHKEHVVIDGGSTDGTVEILREYAQRYPHLKWVSEPDTGLSQALNKGLARARGDAVGVLGDDDYYLPGALARVAEEFIRFPNAGLVSGSCDQVRNDGSLWVTLHASFTTREELLQPWRYWGRPVMLPAPSTFIHRAALEAVGGFDEQDHYAMDYRHWVKISENFPVQTIDETLAVFRCGEGTISFSANRKQRAETMQISRDYWGSPRHRAYWRFLASYLRYYQWQRVLDRLQRLRR
jgi:glycosyltransferase involved in cell wall biosynthesis